MRQWQILTLGGGTDTANRMAPHAPPPVKTGFVDEAMLTPPAGRPLATFSVHRTRQIQNRRCPQPVASLPGRRDGLQDRYALLRQVEARSRLRPPAGRRSGLGNTSRPEQRRMP